MDQYQEQTIANKIAIQQILTESLNISQLNEIPGGIQGTDVIGVFRNSLEDTFYIRYSDLVSSLSTSNFVISKIGFAATASTSTTNNEILSHINTVGFSIVLNELKIIEVIVKKGNVLNLHKYIYKSNLVGDYGTGNTVVAYDDLYLLSSHVFKNEDDSVLIDLGDIGASSIENHLNTNDNAAWVIEVNKTYVFKSDLLVYLYSGFSPRTLGQSNSLVTSNDFETMNNQGFWFIENSWVQKVDNYNYNELEIRDVVYYKDVDFNGSQITLVGWEYLGGNKLITTSYKKVKSIA